MEKTVKGTEQEIINVFEDLIRELAMQRDMIVKLGIMTLEEVTDFLTEKGTKYAEHYAPMSEADIMLERIEAILKKMAKGDDK